MNGTNNHKGNKLNKKLILMALQCALLAGCMAPIGKPEFSCPNKKKGGACAGPRDIYELTNTRDNLEDIDKEPGLEKYAVPKTEEEKNAENSKGVMFDETGKETENEHHSKKSGRKSDESVFVPRDHTQQSTENYQHPQALPQIRTDQSKSDDFDRWPTTTEPLAPEPLAVLNPPKVMRVLIASYKDSNGYLNMPGFVFVQVEPETWSVGEAANLRPQRVIPMKVIDQAKQETNAQQNRARGVSSIEVLPSGKKVD